MTWVPTLIVNLPEVNNIYVDFRERVVICIFNGFWPKTKVLHQWIFSTLTERCDIHLCSRGFFIVKFDTTKDKDYVLNEGPWFWGNAGLFRIPWFSGFDANTMVVSKMLMWVKLHNLPLIFGTSQSIRRTWEFFGEILKGRCKLSLKRNFHLF